MAVVPCSDVGDKPNNGDGHIEVSHTEHDQNHSEHCDFCSPFCTCACCGSLVIVPSCEHIDEMKVLASATYSFPYQLDYSLDYTVGVWHPPSLD